MNQPAHRWVIVILFAAGVTFALACFRGSLGKKSLTITAWVCLIICIVLGLLFITQINQWAKP